MRKSFTTTIDKDLQDQFKQSCKDKGQTMSEVLEAVMREYVQGTLEVDKQVIYNVKRK